MMWMWRARSKKAGDRCIGGCGVLADERGALKADVDSMESTMMREHLDSCVNGIHVWFKIPISKTDSPFQKDSINEIEALLQYSSFNRTPFKFLSMLLR
jgi:hypothetical protein